MKILIPIALAILIAPAAPGQTGEPDIHNYLAMIDGGRADEVRAEIPGLLAKYPNKPGVLYLQARVSKDGAEAVRIYQSIVDNFPRSEWADDALYRVYQYYYALGLYRTAQMKLDQLRREYPNSTYVKGSGVPEAAKLPEETGHPAARVDTPAVAAAPADKGAPSQFSLQVGAYTAQVNAEKQKLFFEDLGYPVEVISKVRDNRSLFTVLVGTFPTYDGAKAKGVEIRKKYNIDSIVISR